jgi:hypothetical protein
VQYKDTQANPELSTAPRVQPVTFGQFAALAHRRKLTMQALAERFRGQIETPSEFFSRVLSDKSPDLVIPYRSVLEFYASALAVERIPTQPVCACGCGAPVFDRKKWALPGCRKKSQRTRVRNQQFWLGQLRDFVDSKVGQNQGMATLPLTEARSA